jgi:transcriptional regulator with XRE-family HTH domain
MGRKRPTPDPRFIRKIRELRDKAGLTQDQVARRSSLQMMTVSKLERGTAVPTVETVFLLAHALDVPAEDLFALLKPKLPPKV